MSEYKNLINLIKKNKEIIYYCKECDNEEIKRIRIYTFRASFKNQKIYLVINKLPILPENIYIYYNNKYKNIISLIKKEPFPLELPEELSENIIPIDEFTIKINTNSSIPYLTKFEKELIDKINLLRKNPKVYIQKLQNRLKYYKNHKYIIPGEIVLNTKEGTKAVKEAIGVLKRTKPISELEIKKELCESSKAHVIDIGSKGMISHYSSTGMSPIKRILSYSKFHFAGEVISFGIFDPEEIVIQFLIDDGVFDRGHRNTLLNPKFKYIGAGCGPHKTYTFMCVVDMAY